MKCSCGYIRLLNLVSLLVSQGRIWQTVWLCQCQEAQHQEQRLQRGNNCSTCQTWHVRHCTSTLSDIDACRPSPVCLSLYPCRRRCVWVTGVTCGLDTIFDLYGVISACMVCCNVSVSACCQFFGMDPEVFDFGPQCRLGLVNPEWFLTNHYWGWNWGRELTFERVFVCASCWLMCGLGIGGALTVNTAVILTPLIKTHSL